MGNAYESLKTDLRLRSHKWLVTGVAGFIGSNLLHELLDLNQEVIGLDNFATGHRHNLEDVKNSVSAEQWKRFHLLEGDIRDLATGHKACQGVEIVLHQAALGSVAHSMEDPILAHDVNVSGFLNVLLAARDAGVKRFVYASSSAVYGDDPVLPKKESMMGKPLSPYAATKQFNEVYADVFQRVYNLQSIGLRYFNVFGPRQDPNGAYAAVIPRWFSVALHRQPIEINGDGETSRDFCYVANVVQGNLLAAFAPQEACGTIYNIALGGRTTLNQLATIIVEQAARFHQDGKKSQIQYRDFRPGDIRHSMADISEAQKKLQFAPSHDLAKGLEAASAWYLRQP